MTQKGTGCRNGEGTLIGLVLFCLFDKLFMLVVFVTGFWSRVSALASRREGLNGRFVKAGSAFYCLIWPCNLGTGALLGCNPRNKKKKITRREKRVRSCRHQGNRFMAKNNICWLSAHRSQSVGMFFRCQRCSMACSGSSVSISTGRTTRQSSLQKTFQLFFPLLFYFFIEILKCVFVIFTWRFITG